MVITWGNFCKSLPRWLSGKESTGSMQETQARSLIQEDPLEKEMPIHSSILAWKSTWTEEAGVLQSMTSQSRIQLGD